MCQLPEPRYAIVHRPVSRIAGQLAANVLGAEAIEVRTLHVMARRVLLDAGRPARLLTDRLPLLRAARRRALAEHPAVGPNCG